MLDGVRDELVDHLPAKITALETATGLTVTDPAEYVVTDTVQRRLNLPSVTVQVEGTTDHDDWLTPQIDLIMPVLVTCVQHEGGDDEENSYRQALLMSRAIQETLDANVEDITGVWGIDVTGIGIEPFGPDVHRRAIEIRADVYVRTTRATS